jgi:hypothetical protein
MTGQGWTLGSSVSPSSHPHSTQICPPQRFFCGKNARSCQPLVAEAHIPTSHPTQPRGGALQIQYMQGGLAGASGGRCLQRGISYSLLTLLGTVQGQATPQEPRCWVRMLDRSLPPLLLPGTNSFERPAARINEMKTQLKPDRQRRFLQEGGCCPGLLVVLVGGCCFVWLVGGWCVCV